MVELEVGVLVYRTTAPLISSRGKGDRGEGSKGQGEFAEPHDSRVYM